MSNTQFWKGDLFSALHSANNMASGAAVSLVLSVGEENVGLDGIVFSGGSELVSWQWFEGTKLDTTDKELTVFPMNRAIPTELDFTIFVDPVVTAGQTGVPLTESPIDFHGKVAAGGRSDLTGDLLKTEYTLMANTNYLLQVQNRHPTTSNLEVFFNLFKFNDRS